MELDSLLKDPGVHPCPSDFSLDPPCVYLKLKGASAPDTGLSLFLRKEPLTCVGKLI